MMKSITILLFQSIFSTFCMGQNKTIIVSVGLAGNVDINAYSANGYVSVFEAANRIFPSIGVGYKNEQQNQTCNTFHTFFQVTGHKLNLDESVFDNYNQREIRGRYLAIAVGYYREWAILRTLLSKASNNLSIDRLYLGVGTDLAFTLTSEFPYKTDSTVTKNGDDLHFLAGSGVRKSSQNQMLNGVLGVRYQVNSKSNEIISVGVKYHWALTKIYSIRYPYSFQNINDDLIVSNRGHIFSFSITIPVSRKNRAE